ncbi:hypothetical protein WR25_02215 [Diploscapter pachys]|uniref:Uncharacterized protein n=1 Tax=Diploscapter pachys TaxID=2018661 RepID=A0A2A2J9M9_9BILA|nr:hypothetical protein WR25_02215 [Diploscapter pachys]
MGTETEMDRDYRTIDPGREIDDDLKGWLTVNSTENPNRYNDWAVMGISMANCLADCLSHKKTRRRTEPSTGRRRRSTA